MNLEAPIRELSHQLAEQLTHRAMDLLAEAQAEINRLQAELAEQTSLRLAAEQALQSERQRAAALAGRLEQERHQCELAEQEVRTIHAAIAAQLELAEAEEERQQQREAERERQWREQLELQRTVWLQEQARREDLERCIARFRSAAGDLLALELSVPAEVEPCRHGLARPIQEPPLPCAN